MKKIVKVGVLICCFIAIGSILYLRYLQFQKKEAEEREWEICIAYRRQNDALIRNTKKGDFDNDRERLCD